MDQMDKKITAYHESGHAIVGLVVEHADPVDKVTIIPRGFSLGATHFMPKKNRLNYRKKEIIDELAICMGGRLGEELFLDDISSGAQQDINQATKLARAMICEWGMSDSLGTVSYEERSRSGQYLGMGSYQDKNYSEETAEAIDKEIKKLLDEAYKSAKSIIENHREKLELMAALLMEFETLDKEDVKKIMDDTWDSEEKKKKLKIAENLQKASPPPIPPKVTNKPDEGIAPQQI